MGGVSLYECGLHCFGHRICTVFNVRKISLVKLVYQWQDNTYMWGEPQQAAATQLCTCKCIQWWNVDKDIISDKSVGQDRYWISPQIRDLQTFPACLTVVYIKVELLGLYAWPCLKCKPYCNAKSVCCSSWL